MLKTKLLNRSFYKMKSLQIECYVPNLALSSALTVSMTNGRLSPWIRQQKLLFLFVILYVRASACEWESILLRNKADNVQH